jgi:hypothetical protein
MDVCVEPQGWEAEAAEIQCLLTDVVQQFLRHFAEPPTGRIRVQFRANDAPMIAFRSSPSDDYRIWLNTRDRLWSQFAYQFAHEFCHILCDYERPRCSCNHWIQESLCEMASLFALKQMAISWQTAPPYPNWREYASSLDAYADEFIAQTEHRPPDGVTLGEWLRVNEPNLRANSYQRPMNGLVAVQLLPLFQDSPQQWQSIRYMPDSNETFDKFVAKRASEGSELIIDTDSPQRRRWSMRRHERSVLKKTFRPVDSKL